MKLKYVSLAFPIAASGLIFTASSMPAHAYLDPGTGSMILQVLLGGVAGLALAGRLYWQRFLSIIGIRRDAPDSETTESRKTATSNSRSDN